MFHTKVKRLGNRRKTNSRSSAGQRRALPPRPELYSHIANDSAADQVQDPPLAAEDLGIAAHLGAKEQAGILELGADANGPFWMSLILLGDRRSDRADHTREASLG